MKIIFSYLGRALCSPLCQRGIMIVRVQNILNHTMRNQSWYLLCVFDRNQSVSVEFPCPVSVRLGVDVPF